MSISRTLWRVQLASIRNIARYDARVRYIFVLVTLFDIALGYWSGSQLMAHIEQWKSFGPLAVRSGLWSISLLTWVSMSLIATLEFLQQGLGDDVSLLLFTLPIGPATRFRAQFGLFFINRLWNWLLLEICITGTVLFLTLGWSQALLWLILLQFGVGCAIYATMVVLMLFIRFILPYIRAKAHLTLWIMLGLASTLALALSMQPQWGAQAVNDIVSVTGAINIRIAGYLGWPEPVFAGPLFALLLLVALGPLARWSGNLYTAAFLVIQSWDRSRRALDIPGVRALSRLMAQQRSFTSALLVKGLLSQSRNFLFWARIVIIVAALALFQPVRTIVQAHGFSDAFFTTGYASALALLVMLEQAPNALSGEGNRLSLYLTAPFSSANILWAKLITFLLPTILVGLATDLFLSWRIGLLMSVGAYSTVALVLVLIGCIALPVLGGIWEENLNFAVEGTIQTIFQEEAAVSPKRVLLVYLSLVLFAASLLILWKLPPTLAIAALLSIDIVILAGMLQWSKMYLRQLLRAG